jgi:hypothetical protein
VKRPTLDEFLDGYPMSNAYVRHPEFKELYVRKSNIGVVIDGRSFECSRVVSVGNVTAKREGRGAFRRLIDDLIGRGFAVYVECVHNPVFRLKLLHMGFVAANPPSPNFLLSPAGHLKEWTGIS